LCNFYCTLLYDAWYMLWQFCPSIWLSVTLMVCLRTFELIITHCFHTTEIRFLVFSCQIFEKI